MQWWYDEKRRKTLEMQCIGGRHVTCCRWCGASFRPATTVDRADPGPQAARPSVVERGALEGGGVGASRPYISGWAPLSLPLEPQGVQLIQPLHPLRLY